MLGCIFGRHSSGAALPGRGDRNCRARGTRRIALKDFYTNVGDARMKLEKNELLTRVFLPQSIGGLSRRLSQAAHSRIDRLSAGRRCGRDQNSGRHAPVQDARVAITAVNPAPMLVVGADMQ